MSEVAACVVALAAVVGLALWRLNVRGARKASGTDPVSIEKRPGRLKWKEVTYRGLESPHGIRLEWWRAEAPHARLEIQRTQLRDGGHPSPWLIGCSGFFNIPLAELCQATATAAEAQEAAEEFLSLEVLRRSDELMDALTGSCPTAPQAEEDEGASATSQVREKPE